jgi:putative transposase
MTKKAADAAPGATKQAPIEMGRDHGRAVHLVHPLVYEGEDSIRCCPFESVTFPS